MKLILISLLFSSVVMAAAPRIDNTQLFVKLNKNKAMPSSALIKSSKKLFGSLYLVQTSDANALKAQLENSDAIAYTENNTFHGVQEIPSVEPLSTKAKFSASAAFNDPKVSQIWAFNDKSRNGVSVETAYMNPIQRNKSEVIVAVVDTGVDYNHEDLRDVMWVNPNEIPANGIDDDNNGYIDDVHGINTLVRDAQGNATGNPMASHAHGTHVAGTIGATQNNRTGIAGIASNVKIMAIRTVPDNADETDVDIVESFLYAAKHGARIINCSFGKSHNEGGMVVNETINHIAESFGTLVIAAAGNDSSFFGKWDIDVRPKYPASFDAQGLMVIAATTEQGSLAYFSNVGKVSVDLAAPGMGVFSTIPDNGYANMSGTSMAAPTTAGVAAEVLSHFPQLTGVELKRVLMESVTPVRDFTRYMATGGRADLKSALDHADKIYSEL